LSWKKRWRRRFDCAAAKVEADIGSSVALSLAACRMALLLVEDQSRIHGATSAAFTVNYSRQHLAIA
jgi:hypothetical protein